MSDAATIMAPPRTPHPSRSLASHFRNAMNARVHGLTARLPQTEAEAAAMKQFADHWTKELGPDTEVQEGLIRASATAFARVERCRKIEEATLRQSALNAVARWEKKKRHAIRAKAQELSADPVNTIADLECSSFGCEWMMRHWVALGAKLSQGVDWEEGDHHRAMTLFGFFPKAPKPGADPFQTRLWDLGRLATGASPNDPEDEPTAARDELLDLIGGEIARLDQIRQELWESIDGPEAESVGHSGMVDTTREGQLRRRYAREAFSEMTRGITLVMRIRVENGKFADRLWWQAHAQHRKPHGVAPFHHPEATPNCLIPSPRSAAPEAEASAPSPTSDSRNEPQTAGSETKHQRLMSLLQEGLRQMDAAEPAIEAGRSQPEDSAPSTPSNASISPLKLEPGDPRWWKTVPARP